MSPYNTSSMQVGLSFYSSPLPPRSRNILYLGVSRYDVHIRRGEGGSWKRDVIREVALILYYRSVPNADKGGGGKKI